MKAHRTNLNENQKQYLKLMYKFRFVSIPLLSTYKGISQVAVKRSLKTLEDRGYVQRRFNQSYFKQNKPASFSLNKQSINYFKDKPSVNDSVLHTMYKNASVADSFVQQSLDIYKIYINLNKLYPEVFNIFTRAETVEYGETFPSPQPDLYISRKDPSDDSTDEYMLDIFTGVQTFVIKKRIDQYIEHFESGDWEDEVYPTVLVVCPNSRVEDQIQEYFENAKDSAFIEDDDLIFMTTTIKALLDLKNSNKKIWSSPYNPKTLLEL